ncbi:MAG: low molecular weight phosphotyrosine protein phosphatase [Steroidobacteraceae bacterium]|jgi:protein-tyrosine phosphatase|nr:low molecular weight phosphotyrosine protein phosphatase [Steroidobacteraceae bacterium]
MRVLFVCLGNICRSPTAEGVLRELARREAPGLLAEVDSAGTADYHVGEAPDPRTCRVAAARGYELWGLRARQVARADFERFDLLLAMDRANLQELQRLAPAVHRDRAQLFLPYAGHSTIAEVPDPYYGDEAGFLRVLELVEEGARGLIARLRDQAG